MPRKGRRSQAVKLSWERRAKRRCSPSPVTCSDPTLPTWHNDYERANTALFETPDTCANTALFETEHGLEPHFETERGHDPHSETDKRGYDPLCQTERGHDPHFETDKRGHDPLCQTAERALDAHFEIDHQRAYIAQFETDSCDTGPDIPAAAMASVQPHLVTYVLASHSQAHPRYGEFRNSQCVANSVTFLAFLQEFNHLTSSDLDAVLNVGNELYTCTVAALKAQGCFLDRFLTADELPGIVRGFSKQHVLIKSQSMGGLFTSFYGDELFLNLRDRLQCLTSEVSYALLIMRLTCIAVFRDHQGRYGFFDPHSRGRDGLHADNGTAVMMLFTCLSDLIDKLTEVYTSLRCFGNEPYELVPICFEPVEVPVSNHEMAPCTQLPPVMNIDDAAASKPVAEIVSCVETSETTPCSGERHYQEFIDNDSEVVFPTTGQQRAIRGNVVCVPSEVQETVNVLPRLRSKSQMLRVKLKRRLCYKGHQFFQTVTWSKLMSALMKLKQVHPQYRNITIRDDADLCDPTLTDDESSSDEAEMSDSEYNEEALEEIYRFESDALCGMNSDSQDNNSGNKQQQENAEDGDQPNGGVILESCLQPNDVSEEIMSFTEGIYCVAPAERNNPVSFFKTPKLEAMSFPVQFPTGQNTLDEERAIKLTPSKYFKTRLCCVDERFARDTNYLFFAQFVTEIYQATSSMTIQLRKGKPFTRDGRRINNAMLQDKREVEKLVRSKDAVRFMTPLRGTPAYWERTTKDLFAMIRQLGTPTFFCTFSAAEMRWEEVITAIKAQQGEVVNFAQLDWATKCEILRSNPVTTMRMFDKRVEALFRDLILSPAQPIGKVVDYFYRLEFQHRGSPHIHCLIWVQGAPVFEEASDGAICHFVSRYISAELPDPQKEPELYKKVTEVQMHSKSHSKTCVKHQGANCRFGFPKQPCDETMIIRPAPVDDDNRDQHKENRLASNAKLVPVLSLLNEPETSSLTLPQLLAKCKLTTDEYMNCLHMTASSSSVVLKREPKDCWVNNYNRHLLLAWDGNLDIQYILNAYSCIAYICSYISKAEHGLSQYLKSVIENSRSANVNESDEMKQIMQAYSKKREVSAQECVARACGLHMKQSSRSVVFVQTSDNALKMSYPLSLLEGKTQESHEVWMTGLPDKYKCRPQTEEFEVMCLADFASTCRIVYGKQVKGKNVLPLLNDMGFVQKRTEKPAVIKYCKYSEQKNPEEYYCALLKLYLPHRADCQLKSERCPAYQLFHDHACVQLPYNDSVERVCEIVKRNRERYEKHSRDIDNAIQEVEDSGLVINEWCHLAPESELQRLESVEEINAREDPNDNVEENVPDYNVRSETTQMSIVTEAAAIDPAVLRDMYRNLNQKQASVFYKVRDWCIKRVCSSKPIEQFFYHINGGAGTGKSHLIKCIHAEATKILQRLPRLAEEADISKQTVVLAAFTGTAAFNISGTTLHCLLKLPRSLKPPYHGLGNKLDEVRAELSIAEILIIDEISMVSKDLFAYVNARLKQIKGINLPFGGMSVLAVGDFFQLPPVRQSKPLCVYDPTRLDHWRDNFKKITLTTIMRQKDDVAFAELLNRLRVKEKSDELSELDRALLATRYTSPEMCPKHILHVFATNKQVDGHNSAMLNLLHKDIVQIDADDYKKDKGSGRMARQASPVQGAKNELPDSIKVASGARVMITRNIDVQAGLCNGMFAKVVKLVNYPNEARVQKLGLELDHVSKTARAANPVYIDRQEEKLKKAGVVRRQFPIKLAFACTIHKVQGMTTSEAAVSLKGVFEHGMGYVALSRVTSLSGLHILHMDERKLHANPEITAALAEMAEDSLENVMPLLHVMPSVDRANHLVVIHHNTEGLSCHVQDVVSHHELLFADVLCFTETHLQGSVADGCACLEGFTMFHRNRSDSYTNCPDLATKRGGGVGICVKSHIAAQEKKYIQGVTDIEFVVVKLEGPLNVLIAAVYRPPGNSLRTFLPSLGNLLRYLEVMDHHQILVSCKRTTAITILFSVF
ncbi:uncharacterized protein [Syngnathus scovelli]|uniref:uncharacterized protein isoform X5 n=1 Tax=Syngnathus scovelli TaxID=161590 RepID=UPI002110DD83|nr:uncharacterized protein LOC125975202 isoform X10 [Syngnathus scovelli]XP_049586414.1 uncharacterized protein LOC125975202 isoform X10 [Syngnathus scovelli]XP_049586415.1 uncharacterized protein LOC125975202 isoform X10 [Syngnathus scovelli]XP_049586416.1 uncharacterized protein LOC125975202 isoform X10 [Syngnathus scovelli]XP_049586418.1 uncharacterized protein LOC125975202 isoform X10 [Syngnathus scovelli]XP_049586419.1 uncharacterized protein LOC125975202 isoform X10 [Syngnathus scovelli]